MQVSRRRPAPVQKRHLKSKEPVQRLADMRWKQSGAVAFPSCATVRNVSRYSTLLTPYRVPLLKAKALNLKVAAVPGVGGAWLTKELCLLRQGFIFWHRILQAFLFCLQWGLA